MAVSKRIRFEVLRRDNYTCRYCRSTDNPLTVDHVTPVALGGTDKPDNLVAACKDCNAGKSSASPDSSLVDEVREDALRHAEMIKQAYAVVVARMGERDDYIDQFAEAFPGQPVPDNWRQSVGRWFEMGVPIELVTDAARLALSKPQRFHGDGRFKYLCGIIWNQVHAVNEAVELKSAILGAFKTEADLADVEFDAYQIGIQTGRKTGFKQGVEVFHHSDKWHRVLCNVVEGTHAGLVQQYEAAAPDIIAAARGPIPDPPDDPWEA